MSRCRIIARKKGAFEDLAEILISGFLIIIVVWLFIGITTNIKAGKKETAREGFERIEGNYLMLQYLRSPVSYSKAKDVETISDLIVRSYLDDENSLSYLRQKTLEFFDNSPIKSKEKDWLVEIYELPGNIRKPELGGVNTADPAWATKVGSKKIIAEQILPLPMEEEGKRLKITLAVFTRYKE